MKMKITISTRKMIRRRVAARILMNNAQKKPIMTSVILKVCPIIIRI